MSQETFHSMMVEMRDSGRNQKKALIREMVTDWDQSEWEVALRVLSGAYASTGVGKATAIDAVINSGLRTDGFRDAVEETGTVTEALIEHVDYDDRINTLVQGTSVEKDQLSALEDDVETVERLGGNRLTDWVAEMLSQYDQPHVVTFALLDDWQTGVTETTIANALGEYVGARTADVQRARSLEPDPVAYARACVEGRFDDLVEPTVGKAFKPMKAIREEYFPDDTSGWYAEPKLDGHRLLVHVDNGDVTAYTRRLNDATASLPELQEINWPDGEWILDGEVMASDGSYTTTSEMVGSNQERDLDDRAEYVTFHTFDVLLWRNCDITTENYNYRRSHLEEMDFALGAFDCSYLDVVPQGTVAEMMDYAERNDLEGIIVKRADSTYEFGKRSQDWVKRKLSEVTVDLVMASFEEGESESTAGTLGGVRLETADGRYVGNVGNGVSDELRDEIWQNRSEYRGETVEITFEGLGTNDELRFPRIERLRIEDGEPDDFDRLKGLAEQV